MPIPIPGLGFSIGTSADVLHNQQAQELVREQQDKADAAAVLQKLASMGDDDERIIQELPRTNRPPGAAASALIAKAVGDAQQRQRIRQLKLGDLLTKSVTTPGTPGGEDPTQSMSVMPTPAVTRQVPTTLTERVLGATPLEALHPGLKGLSKNLVDAGESEAKLGVAETGRWTRTPPDINGNVWLIDGKTSQVKPAAAIPGQLLQFIPEITPTQMEMLRARGVDFAVKAGETKQREEIESRMTAPPQATSVPEGGEVVRFPAYSGRTGYVDPNAPAAAPAGPASPAAPAPAGFTPVPPRAAAPAPAPAAPAPAPAVGQAGPPAMPPIEPQALTLAIMKTPGGAAAFQALSPQEQGLRLIDATIEINTKGKGRLEPNRGGLAPAVPAVQESVQAAQGAPAPAAAPPAPAPVAAAAPPAATETPLPKGTIRITGKPRPMTQDRADTIMAKPDQFTPSEVEEAKRFTAQRQGRAIEQREAEARATAKVELEQPIGEKNVEWIDGSSRSLDPPSADMPKGKVFSDPRYVRVELNQRNALKKLDTVREELAGLREKAKDVFKPGERPLKAWARIQKESWFGTSQQAETLRRLETARTILAPQIQKVALEDVGNMAVQEQAVVRQALAGPFNSLESALAGIDVLERFLEATPKRILAQAQRQMGRSRVHEDSIPSGILVPEAGAAPATGRDSRIGAPRPKGP